MKKVFSFFLSLILTISLFIVSGCSKVEKQNSDGNNKLSIVTTIFPYYDFARAIAGDKAEVKLLLSPGSEPHSYEPSPSDIVAIENCDIFIYNGGESDEWVEGMISSLDNKSIRILCMMDYVEPLFEQTPEHEQGDEYDEHIWTSLVNAEKIVSAICDEIVKIDSKSSKYYFENRDDFISLLSGLDGKFKNTVNESNKKTVVFGDRFPFLYFVTEYGLDYECAFPGCSSETEPSISKISGLIDYVRENNIPVVFYLEFSSGKIARIISEDSTAKAMRFYSCHNVTKEQFENGETYISLMEQNLEALKEALS